MIASLNWELNTAHASCQVSLDWSTCSPWLPLQSFQTLWLLFSVLADYFASYMGNSQCICNKLTNLPISVPILLLQRRRNLFSCPKLILFHVLWVSSLPTCPNRQEAEFNWQIFSSSPWLLGVLYTGGHSVLLELLFPLAFVILYMLSFFCASLSPPMSSLLAFPIKLLNVEGPQGYTIPFCVPLTISFKSPSLYCSVCVCVYICVCVCVQP